MLEQFKISIDENQAKIGVCEHKISEALGEIQKFMKSDMFINSENNYMALQRRLMAQEERYVRQTLPDIEKLRASFELCASNSKLKEL